MAQELPPELTSSLDRLTEGWSHRDLAERAAALSQRYRAGGRSAEVIRDEGDALAYALARLPATYAAVAAALTAASQVSPAFCPRTLLDIGAGPGSATWAATRQFSSIERIGLLDGNRPLRALALALMAASSDPALQNASYAAGTFASAAEDSADLVIASYLVGELAPDALANAAEALWSRAAGMLIVVEPGTPAGFIRIRDLRAHLIGRGAHVPA